MAKLTEGKEIAVAEALTPSQPQITPYDEQFMQKVMEFIEEQMDNAELTIDEFAEHLMLSRTIFYRKLKSIIGLTLSSFIAGRARATCMRCPGSERDRKSVV